MRSSESRAEFARSLPQEVLSELVVAMSSLDLPPLQLDAIAAPGGQRRSAPHELDEAAEGRPAKKRRASDAGLNGTFPASATQAAARKPGPRASLPGIKPGPKPGSKRRASAAVNGAQPFSANQKLNFCADLLSRMLSGPGKPSPSSSTFSYHAHLQPTPRKKQKLTPSPLHQASGRA